MARISTGLSIAALAAVLAGMTLPARAPAGQPVQMTARKPDFGAVDPMPVGTARQVERAKRVAR